MIEVFDDELQVFEGNISNWFSGVQVNLDKISKGLLMKVGDIARRFHVKPSNVRYISGVFAAYLSPAASGSQKGVTRIFTDDDCRVVATIYRLQRQGFRNAEIVRFLQGDEALDDCPPEPKPEGEQYNLVTSDEAENRSLRAQMQYVVSELRDARSETKGVREENRSLHRQIGTLERQVGAVEGRLEEIVRERKPSGYWLRWIVLAFVFGAVVTTVIFLFSRVVG